MREKPFLGQYTLKYQEIRKWEEIMMKSCKYGPKWYNDSSREFLIENPSQRKTNY
jgi:hypothetical protein